MYVSRILTAFSEGQRFTRHFCQTTVVHLLVPVSVFCTIFELETSDLAGCSNIFISLHPIIKM